MMKMCRGEGLTAVGAEGDDAEGDDVEAAGVEAVGVEAEGAPLGLVELGSDPACGVAAP